MTESPYATKYFKSLKFLDWLNHMQSSKNVVQIVKNDLRGQSKIEKKNWDFNLENKILLTKLTVLIPKL